MKAFITQKGPKARGPYSTVVTVGSTHYVSGMIPTDPETGAVPEGIEAQTRRTLDNIRIVLGELGMTFENIAKVSLFLTDIKDFAAVNAIYAEYFKDCSHFPARSCVEVSGLVLGVKLEIEVIAVAE